MQDDPENPDLDIDWSRLRHQQALKQARPARQEMFNLDTRAGICRKLHKIVKDDPKAENQLSALKQLAQINGVSGPGLDNLRSAKNSELLEKFRSLISVVVTETGGEFDWEGVDPGR